VDVWPLSRRAALRLATLAAAGALVPGRAWGRAPEEEHRPFLDLPVLAEDPTAVPVRVGVDHPMERDHFITSIELTLPGDPIPHKGAFRFTPASGRAWVAFPMRSGLGGLLRATVECSRHGRFAATRELRVAGDGCAAVPAPPDKTQVGRPRLRLPRTPAAGETVEVWARVEHDSDTGLTLRAGSYVRVRPAFFVRRMRVYLDRDLVSDFQFTAALSPNPIIRFPLKVTRTGRLRVIFVNNRGQQWEATERIQPAG